MVAMVMMTTYLFGGLHTIVGGAYDGTGKAELLCTQLNLCAAKKTAKLPNEHVIWITIGIK